MRKNQTSLANCKINLKSMMLFVKFKIKQDMLVFMANLLQLVTIQMTMPFPLIIQGYLVIISLTSKKVPILDILFLLPTQCANQLTLLKCNQVQILIRMLMLSQVTFPSRSRKAKIHLSTFKIFLPKLNGKEQGKRINRKLI